MIFPELNQRHYVDGEPVMKCSQCKNPIDKNTFKRLLLVSDHTPTPDGHECDTVGAVLCSYRCLTEWAEEKENTPAS